jgi:hypothetical protein
MRQSSAAEWSCCLPRSCKADPSAAAPDAATREPHRKTRELQQSRRQPSTGLDRSCHSRQSHRRALPPAASARSIRGPGWCRAEARWYVGLNPRRSVQPSQTLTLQVKVPKTEGEFKLKLGDRIVSAPAQSVMFVPRGTAHTFQNVGTEPGVILVGVTPGGAEKMFEERQGADAETLRALAKKYNMEVVGPPIQ